MTASDDGGADLDAERDANVDVDAEADDQSLRCGHDPGVGYVVEFVVREDVDGIDSACAMRAAVHEREPSAADVDAVGCTVEDCENHHERVAASLRRDAARHSGNVTCDVPDR